MEHAYLAKISDPYISGEFLDEDQTFSRDFEFDGYIIHKCTLKGLVIQNIMAPDDFVQSAPKTIVVDKVFSKMPDFGFGPWGGFGLASEEFVNLVEEIEPGVHQFIKIEKTMDKKKNIINKNYYIMNIMNSFAATNIEKSSVIVRNTSITLVSGEKQNIQSLFLDRPHRLFLKKSIVGNSHLWLGAIGDIGGVFFSEKLYKLTLERKFTPLKTIKVCVE